MGVIKYLNSDCFSKIGSNSSWPLAWAWTFFWLFALSNSFIPYLAFQIYSSFSAQTALTMLYLAICIYWGDLSCSNGLTSVWLVCNLVQVPLHSTGRWHTSLFIIIILADGAHQASPSALLMGTDFLRCCWFSVWILSSISMCEINYKAQWNGFAAKDWTALLEGHCWNWPSVIHYYKLNISFCFIVSWVPHSMV